MADDNRAFLQKLMLSLTADFDVIASAADGKVALELIRIHRPDVIVLDLAMPGLNGLEVAREAARILPSSRIVICSLEMDLDVVEAAREAGASAYVFKTRIAEELKFAIQAAAPGSFFASPAVTRRVPGRSNWAVSGSYLKCCNCDMEESCVSFCPPTAAECTALFGWRIDDGGFDGIDLSGLNVAAAMYSPRNSAKWKAALYIDSRARSAQKEALTSIFSGNAGGQPETLGAKIGEVLGVRIVPIEFHDERNGRRLRIAGIGDVEIESLRGHSGTPITIAKHPLSVAPGYPAELGKSKRLSYADHGFHWDVTDAFGVFSPFEYTNW